MGQDRSSRGGRRNPTPTEYALVAVAAAVLGLVAVPSRPVDPDLLAGRALAQQTHERAERFRAALASYRFDHVSPAGYEARIPGVPRRGELACDALRDQLVQSSNRRGATAPPGFARWPLGPYLPEGLPVNPLNGLKTVRLLAEDEPFPPEADGTSGWILKPATGELRPNAPGTVPGTDLRHYDL